MGVASTVLVIVAALAVLQSTAAISQNITAYGCAAYRFNVVLDSYNFTSFMGDYDVPASCNRTFIKCAQRTSLTASHVNCTCGRPVGCMPPSPRGTALSAVTRCSVLSTAMRYHLCSTLTSRCVNAGWL